MAIKLLTNVDLEHSVGAMRDEVTDILMGEGASEPPSSTRIVRALNRAKNDVMARLDQLSQDDLILRVDRAVATGDMYITLPDGATAGEAAMRRLLGCNVVQADATEDAIGISSWSAERVVDTGAFTFWMYREGSRLYFYNPTGASTVMTIRLRYTPLVPDLDGTDSDAVYTNLPLDCAELLVMRAALALLPARMKDAFAKWTLLATERENIIYQSRQRQIATEPISVKRVGADYGGFGGATNFDGFY